MDIGKTSERLMGMDDAVWERHANPYSGWSRVPVLPLLALAIWSRVWIGWWSLAPIALIFLWIWLNPRLFSAPVSTDNWMSKGVMGERVWLNRKKVPIPVHHERVTALLNMLAGLGLIPFAYGLYQLNEWMVIAGTVIMMIAKLWFLDRMVWLLEDMNTGN